MLLGCRDAPEPEGARQRPLSAGTLEARGTAGAGLSSPVHRLPKHLFFLPNTKLLVYTLIQHLPLWGIPGHVAHTSAPRPLLNIPGAKKAWITPIPKSHHQIWGRPTKKESNFSTFGYRKRYRGTPSRTLHHHPL